MGRHNGSKKPRIVPLVDAKSGEVVSLHPLRQFQQQERLVTFGHLKVGDRFQLVRTESSPKDGDCPIFIKTELARMDESNPSSDLFNCIAGFWKGWLSVVTPVIPLI